MNYFKSFRGIPRNIWLLAIASFINRVGSMAISYLVLYMTNKIGVSMSEAGIVLASFGVGSLISNPIAGRLSDKVGPLRLVKISMIGLGIVLFFFPFFTDYYSILIVTVFWAIIGESYRPATLSFIAENTPKSVLSKSYALNRLAVNLGMGIGPLVGGFISEIDYSWLFYIDGGAAILSGIYLIFVRWDKVENVNSEEDFVGNATGKFYHDKRLLLYLLALLPIVLVLFQFFSAMPLYIVEDLGFKNSVFGMLVTVNTTCILLFEVPLNDKISKLDLRKVLAFGALLISIGFGGMVFSTTFFPLMISVIIWTFGEMIIFPVSSTYMAQIAPPKRKGEYMGYYGMLFSITFSVAPWLGTKIFENFGAAFLWSAAFFTGLISSILFLRLKENLEK